MLGRRKRDGYDIDGHDHHHTMPDVPSSVPNIDISRGGAFSGYSGSCSTLVDKSGKAKSVSVILDEDNVFNMFRSRDCAEYHMGPGAISKLTASKEPAGYERPSTKNKIADVGGVAMVSTYDLHGPIRLECVDAEGLACPERDSCKTVKSVASWSLYTRGALTVVPLPEPNFTPTGVTFS